MYAVILGTDLSVKLVKKPEGKEDLDFCYEQIGCSMIQIVRPAGLDRPYVMVVDEEGLLTDQPTLNYLGSYLYGTQMHGIPIVGDVLIVCEIGYDIALMPKEQAELVAMKMGDLAMTAYHTIGKVLERRIQKGRRA